MFDDAESYIGTLNLSDSSSRFERFPELQPTRTRCESNTNQHCRSPQENMTSLLRQNTDSSQNFEHPSG